MVKDFGSYEKAQARPESFLYLKKFHLSVNKLQFQAISYVELDGLVTKHEVLPHL